MELKDNEKAVKQVFSMASKPDPSLKGLKSHKRKGIKNTEEVLYKNVLYQFDEREVYLMKNLSLIRLSQIVGTNTSYLSRVINQYFGMNFRKLVNTYRIGYAKRLLRERRGEETIKLGEIIHNCGYSSRSVFYDAFYRVTGMTPQQYMREEEE